MWGNKITSLADLWTYILYSFTCSLLYLMYSTLSLKFYLFSHVSSHGCCPSVWQGITRVTMFTATSKAYLVSYNGAWLFRIPIVLRQQTSNSLALLATQSVSIINCPALCSILLLSLFVSYLPRSPQTSLVCFITHAI